MGPKRTLSGPARIQSTRWLVEEPPKDVLAGAPNRSSMEGVRDVMFFFRTRSIAPEHPLQVILTSNL